MCPLLEIENLSVSFGTIQAVDGISFQVGTKETLALVGESGSGKSVTALSILQLLKQCRLSGSIRFGGRELIGLSEETLCRFRGSCIGAIFQDPMTSLNPIMPVGAQIAEGAASKKEALELLKAVELPEEYYSFYPHQLSGGQRQRVMIAIALAQKPQLLIADEPTTSLDAATQDQILKLLKKLQLRFGMSLLLITHDFGVVSGLADRVVVMREGKIIEEGTPDRIYHSPASGYTRTLVHAHQWEIPLHPDSAPPLLEMRRVEKKYGKTAILKKISLTLHEGETLALIGASGAGKSTLARLLLQLEKPTAGEILYRNQPHTHLLPKEIQIVFQNPYSTLDPHMTVRQILSEPYEIHRLPHDTDTLEGLLTSVGLGIEFLDRRPHAMSGGQRQRVGIARALAVQPKLLILDEPLSALDLATQHQILALLRKLKEQQNLTYLFITHDLALVRAMATRVAVMCLGQIVETAPTAKLFSSPEHAYTQSLLSVVPYRDPRQEKLRRQGVLAAAP